MIYLIKHNQFGSKRNKIVISICVVLIGIAILTQFLAPHFFPALFTSIFRPFWRMEFSINSGSLQSPEALIKQNEDLRRQLLEVDIKLQTIRAIELENDELKALMGRASTTQSTLAAVLRRPPISAYDELIIDLGKDHGLSTTSLVYVSGVLLGRVSEVLEQTSKVLLFTSPGQKVDVLIGSDHLPATAIGRGGGQYEVELPRDVKISEGDFIIAPSLDSRPLGVVTSIISDPIQPFEKILFSPPVNIYQLRWVSVGI
jgi:rod shape-determining protein MreC